MKILAVLALALMPAQPAADPALLPAPPGARLIQTSHIEGPLELKQATADDEAVLAGNSYVQQTYARPGNLTAAMFVASYRDALFAAGWKLIDVTKIAEAAPPPETLTIAAHYMSHGRNIYARVRQEPDGRIQIAVADVGAENWPATLATECRVRVYSLHFDLDRPTLREYESEPTLEKLADLLKSKSAPAVEIQGHMDNIGEAGASARQTLSEGRAKIVASWLVAHGVPAAKVTSRGYGKTRPVAENDSDLGRALNRRIEVARRDCL
jgi:outer membrane protein OmpA-like peptidoglycan-associated protein